MNYLLDTNIVSEARRSRRLPEKVVRRLAELRGSQCFLSVISLFEIEIGIRRVERNDPLQGAVLRRWKVQTLTEAFRGRVLPVDEAVAEAAATLHVPNPRPQMDCFIAATAIVHGMTLVTRNVADFESLPVAILDPWADV